MRLYEACTQAGITLLSIAHRPALKRFHQLVVHFDGNTSGSGKGWWIEDVDAKQQPAAAQQAVPPQLPPLQAEQDPPQVPPQVPQQQPAPTAGIDIPTGGGRSARRRG